MVREYGAGRPDAEDEKELRDFSRQIFAKLAENTNALPVKLPGNRPYRDYKNGPIKPSAGKKCVKCGLCAQSCPCSAIPKESPDTTVGDRCITCMRCVSICPAQARSISKVMQLAIAQKLKKACAGRKPNVLYI